MVETVEDTSNERTVAEDLRVSYQRIVVEYSTGEIFEKGCRRKLTLTPEDMLRARDKEEREGVVE